MTEMEERLLAHVAATQTLAAATAGLLLSMIGNDPDLSKAKALLQAVQMDFAQGIDHLPPQVQEEAKNVLSDLANRVIARANDYRSATRPN